MNDYLSSIGHIMKPRIKTDSCGWCAYWVASGNACTHYEQGACCRYPKHVCTPSNYWCGEYKSDGGLQDMHGPSKSVPSYRDRYIG